MAVITDTTDHPDTQRNQDTLHNPDTQRNQVTRVLLRLDIQRVLLPLILEVLRLIPVGPPLLPEEYHPQQLTEHQDQVFKIKISI